MRQFKQMKHLEICVECHLDSIVYGGHLIQTQLSLSMLTFTELLNKVCGLTGCPLKGQLVRTNRRGRFVFGGGAVLVGSSGDQVSFYTTVGAK